MTKSLIILPCFSFLISCFLSCKKTDNECVSFTKAPVTKVEGPNSGLVNQDINLTVYFTCFNSCGQFGNIEQNSWNDTVIINVNAKYKGCACLDVLLSREITYQFKSIKAGIYYLKFWQDEKSYLVDTIIIQ